MKSLLVAALFPASPLPSLQPELLRAAIADLDSPVATSAQLRVSGAAGRWYGAEGFADGRRAVRPDDSRLACANFPNAPGSAGAPVFVHNANGVYAAGVSVGSAGTSFTCFVTIDDLLAHWKVWLPVQPLPGPIVR